MAREDDDFKDNDHFTQPGGMSTGVKTLIGLGAVFGLLIVVGFVAMVLALPAIQQSREEARRAQMRENLKQIELAMQNYADTQKYLPMAPIPAPAPVTESTSAP